MYNQASLEAACVATYVEDYLEILQTTADVIQPHASAIRKADVQLLDILSRLDTWKTEVESASDAGSDVDARDARTEKAVAAIKLLLAHGQLNGDEKLAKVGTIEELLSSRCRRLEQDAQNFEVPHLLHQTPQSASSPCHQPNTSVSQSALAFASNSPLTPCSSTGGGKRRVMSPTASLTGGGSAAGMSTSARPRCGPGTMGSSGNLAGGGREESGAMSPLCNVGAGVRPSASTGALMGAAWKSSTNYERASPAMGSAQNKRGGGTQRRARQRQRPSYDAANQSQLNSSADTSAMGADDAMPPSGRADSPPAAPGAPTPRKTDAKAKAAAGGTASTKAASAKDRTVDPTYFNEDSNCSTATEGNKSLGAGGTPATSSKDKRKSVAAASSSLKKRRRESNAAANVPVEPDEPLYCFCKQVSYGDMVGCDNDDCTIEWFHFRCVQLASTPKGKWFCPDCRGDKSTSMAANGGAERRTTGRNNK